MRLAFGKVNKKQKGKVMRLFKVWVLVIAFFSVHLFAANSHVDKPAKGFTLPDLKTGNNITLDKFEGRVVYLDFWASWCKPCVKSFPKLDELHKKYKKSGFDVIAINLDQNKNKALEFIRQRPVSYTLLYDKNASVAMDYKVQAMPSSYFIDKKGVIRLTHSGFRPGDEDKIEKAVKLLLAE